MLRVLMLTADYPPNNWSGIGVVVERQSRALAALDIEVHVLVASQYAFEHRAVPDHGSIVHVHHLNPEHCPIDPRRFDLVHLHSLALSEFAFELQRRFGLPLIYTAHSLLHLELPDTPHARPWCVVQASVLALSDWVIFLSNAERAAAVDLVPALQARSSVVPNPVPSPPTLTPAFPKDGPVVFAGRFARSKGVELLAELVPLILARHRCKFVLAGGHGTAAGSRVVSDLAARYPQACAIKAWLCREKLDELLASSLLVLVPSLYEPFGLIALEAMRLGAPVLASDAGGLPEVVTDGSGGRIVPGRDAMRWCKAAVDILSTPAIAGNLRRRGPAYVQDRFAAPRVALALHRQVYGKVI